MDPIADKSQFICTNMSSHPDTLVAYVKYFGKVQEKVTDANMTAIDRNGMTLAYKESGSTASKNLRVDFIARLSRYDEVKPCLISMSADAQEALRMKKPPRITYFELPPGLWKPSISIELFGYAFASQWFSGALWSPGHFIFNSIGKMGMNRIGLTAAVTHVLQTLYCAYLCSKHQTGIFVGLQYTLSTFFCGFFILVPLRKRIQRARIDSVTLKGDW